MRISVVIPVRDGERFLGDALRSAAGQELPPFEVVVVDDGSTDASGRIARESGARCLRQETRGPGAARNAGVAAARGDAIAFLDADDVWLPSKLRVQARRLEEVPGLAAVVTHVRPFLEPGCTPPPHVLRTGAGADRPGWLPSTLLVRRAAFLAVGPFDESLRTAEDVDWFARAQACSLPMELLPDVLVLRRLHDRNISWNARMVPDALTAVLRSVRRRRGEEQPRA